MMKSAAARQSDDSLGRRGASLNGRTSWSISRARMDAIVVVVPDELTERPPAMVFVEDAHMVEQLSSYGSSSSLSASVLPGTANRCRLGFESNLLDCLDDSLHEDRIFH